jgi:hypothetical protein
MSKTTIRLIGPWEDDTLSMSANRPATRAFSCYSTGESLILFSSSLLQCGDFFALTVDVALPTMRRCFTGLNLVLSMNCYLALAQIMANFHFTEYCVRYCRCPFKIEIQPPPPPRIESSRLKKLNKLASCDGGSDHSLV